MPNPVLPLIPWRGGLKLDRNLTLAHHSQLSRADDIIYHFDGTRRKRGGQSHRNRIPIPGGRIDDHMTKAPPGDWTATGSVSALTVVDNSTWRAFFSASGVVTLSKEIKGIGQFPSAFTARVRVKTIDLITSGTYFRLSADPGTGSGLYRLGVRMNGDGIEIETASTVWTVIAPANGTMEDFNLTLNGQELYEIDTFHVWRFDIVAGPRVKIYFDELLIFTSNVITTLGSAGDNATVVLEWNNPAGGRLDFSIDYVAVTDDEESTVMGLFDFPRVADGIVNPTAHRMVAVVNSRVYVDPGDHQFLLISENYEELINPSPRNHVDCAAFIGKLIIAREHGNGLLRWDASLSRAELISGSPLGSMLRVHRNRLWVAGDRNHPARLYWSGLLNETVWTLESSGDFVDSGFEDIDPEDGGIIIGIGPSFHGQLIIYKTTGIYRIVGSDFLDFAMSEVTKAIGGASHHTIQNVGNDQYFVSPYGVHSLLTTEKFGDYEDAFLSHDIRDLWNRGVNSDYLRFAWAVNNEPADRYELLLSLGVDVGTSGILPNRILCLHYGVRDELHPIGRWSVKKIRGGSSLSFTDEDGRRRGFVGGIDGFVNRQDELFKHDFPVYKATPGTQVEL